MLRASLHCFLQGFKPDKAIWIRAVTCSSFGHAARPTSVLVVHGRGVNRSANPVTSCWMVACLGRSAAVRIVFDWWDPSTRLHITRHHFGRQTTFCRFLPAELVPSARDSSRRQVGFFGQ